MRLLAQLLSSLRFLFRRRAVERQIDEELRAHAAHRAADLVRRGTAPADAERQARAELGTVGQVKEDIRDALPTAMHVDAWTKDVRYALRRMRAAPGFTAVAALTLALGIGGTSAIFSVVKAVLLDPLPYADPGRLVLLWNELRTQGVTRAPGSGFELAQIRERARSFDGVAGIWAGNGTILGEGDPEQIKVGFVTGNMFPVLGARPALGRTLSPDDEGSGRAGVVVLGYGLWQRRFGGDAGIVGRSVRFDGRSATVVGVMPRDFRMVFPPDAQVPVEIQAWMPFAYDIFSTPKNLHFLRYVARLAPGVTVAQANAEAAAIGKRLSAEFIELGEDGIALSAVPMHADAVHEIRPALVALFAGVALVLLIACVNVANLLLARGSARRKEMALRAAVGASRGRLVRQLMLESLMLALLGGILGLLLGGFCLERLAALAPPGVLPAEPLALDRGVLAFAALVTLVAGVAFGIAPALESSRVDLADALKSAAGSTGGMGRRARAALVVGEVALSFVLLVGAGLMIRTFVAVQGVDPGLRPAGALTFEITLPGRRYPGAAERTAFARTLSERLRALPGVSAVGGVSHLPFDDYPNWYSPYSPEGASDERRRSLMADHRAATPDYLGAIGATLVKGRFHDALDEAAGRAVVVVDEKLAAEAWPGEDPLGKTLECEHYEDDGFAPSRVEVVGVVRHVLQHALTRQVRGQIYIPYARSARPHLSFVVRTGGDPLLLVDAVRAQVANIDRELALAKVRPLADYLERAARPARFTMVLATIFGGLALALAAIGLYGVIATSVSQRRREIGVRLALGAVPRRLVRQVLAEGLTLTFVGLALGVAGSLLATRLLGVLLFGVSPLDPATYLVAAAVLPVAALLACWLPARLAARESPMAALRLE